MNEYERAREQVKKLIEPLNERLAGEFACNPREVMEFIDDDSYKVANQILSTEGIAILTDDQSLPENPNNYEDECREYTAYSRAQQDMLRDNFRRVVQKVVVEGVEKTAHQVGFDMKEEK